MTAREEISHEWDGILRPTERILWQGAPQSGEPYLQAHPAGRVIGLFLIVGFAVYSFRKIGSAQSEGEALLLYAISGIFIVGLLLHLIGTPLLDAYKVRNRFYTLTNRRAFIGSTAFGRRSLDQWPVDRAMKIELEDGILGHVHFAERTFRTRWGTGIEKIGFRNIPDAAHVHSLMLKVQEGTA